MNRSTKNRSHLARLLLVVLSCTLSFSAFRAASEDIDIFSAQPDSTPNKPNVLIVLDNSANWSRAAQHWTIDDDGDPDTPEVNYTQGQSEARALRNALMQIPLESVNIGLFQYRTEGSAGDQDGGYTAYHIRPMTAANRDIIVQKLDRIRNNITDPIEKRPIGNPFGTLLYDVYNYLSGSHAFGTDPDPGSPPDPDANASRGDGTPASPYADTAGYFEPPVFFRKFRSPLTAVDTCTRTIIIFIGNNREGQLTADSDENAAALLALGGSTAQLPFAEFDVRETPTQTNLGETTCFASQPNCSTLPACLDGGFTSCTCSNPVSCGATEKFRIWGEKRNITPGAETRDPASGTTRVATGEAGLSCTKAQDVPTYNCPSASTIDSTPAPDGSFTRTVTTFTNCAYEAKADDPTTTADDCTGQRANYEARGDRVITTTPFSATYDASAAVDPAAYSLSCQPDDNPSCSLADFPQACADGSYRNCDCNVTDTIVGGCGASTTRYTLTGHSNIVQAIETGQFRTAPADVMADEWARFLRNTGVQLPGTGTDPVTNPAVKMRISTYTIDVFKDQQSADFSALLFSMARAGGGKYFQARNESQIQAAILAILQEAQAVNSAFSSASLPVNATNRAQNENQVFIGVFKPDQGQEPRWFGNLKRYQLKSTGFTIELAGEDNQVAINNQTGFIGDCAKSFWTTDSESFWQAVISTDPPYAQGACPSNTTNDFSDEPDGPFVEKGAAAEVMRKGNDPAAIAEAGTGNYALNRSMRTVPVAQADRTNGMTPPLFDNSIFEDGDPGTDDAVELPIVNFTKGADVNDEDQDNVGATPPASALTEPRASIHGDVIHSRPLPVNYGGTPAEIAAGTKMGVVVYYGANDGAYRAVRAQDGRELWSFVAPEHFAKLGRLKNNVPTIKFFGEPDTIGDPPVPTGEEPKDYFFDGSTGVFQNANNSKVWIFATMRRGGRMLYAFDVTDTPAPADGPADPKYLWNRGCDAAGNCDPGFEEMGQTWSFPNVAFIKGYSPFSSATPRPVVIVGGGYNAPCEDNISGVFTGCAGGRGSGVYVLDAQDGTLLQHFNFSGHGVAGDVALIDANNDGNVDYAYAADTGGNIYRMNFVSGATELAAGDWTSARIAHTDNGNRKFLFTPALFQAASNIVYLAIGSGDREQPLMAQYACGGDADENGICDDAVTNRFYVFKDHVDQSYDLDLDDTTSGVMENYTSESEPTGCPDADPPDTPNTSPVCLNERGLFPNESPQSPLANAQRGWFIDLTANGAGEQVVTSAVITAGFVIFSTNRPTPVNAVACSTSLGEARGYFMNLFNASGAIGVAGAEGGDRSSVFVGGGLPPSPVVAVVPIGGVLKPVVIGAVQKDGGASSPIGSQEVRPPIKSYRTPVYWYKSGDTDTE